MIREISNFVESIAENDPEYFTSNLNPSPGLHITLELDENSEVIENSYKSYIFKKDGTSITINNEGNEIPIESEVDFAKLEYYSDRVGEKLNKILDLPAKKIHSCSPYILWFKKEKLKEAKGQIEHYFRKALAYIDSRKSKGVDNISNFSLEKLFTLIENDPNYNGIKKIEYIKVYFMVEMEAIIKSHKAYLSDRLYLKTKYNITTNQNTFGLGTFLMDDNDGKVFMKHQTTDYLISDRINQSKAINLYKFQKLLRSKPRKLPNPLPIFIEKDELNNDVIRLFGCEGVKNYHNIIKQMFENKQADLTNYYLLNWNNTKNGIVINDVDFVSAFEYKIDNLALRNIMQLPNISNIQIKNIFQFELEIVNKIFDLKYMDYFGELDAKYFNKRTGTFQNLLTYRKNFYDFIYKSKREAVNGLIFYKIVMTEILDEIKRNDDFNNDWQIKEKLNILFSINEFFDKTNKNFGGLQMASQIPEFQIMMRKLFTDENYHIENDNDFAFASGQLIYCILKESKSSNKSHALLEPFISKNEPKLFNEVIIRSISQYKHAFEWYGEYGKGRFEKLTGEILGYNCETSIKKLLPMILAGYFSQSMIFESKKTMENENGK